MHLKKGYKLHNGKYQLLDVIGEGGFSLTYKGSWKTEVKGALGKIPALVPVCIKEYFLKDYCFRDEPRPGVITSSVNGKEIFDKYKEQLIREAKILSEVHHPNIVSVLEVFRQNNTVYIVMEFISGKSLKQIYEESGVFPEKKLLEIIYQIGQALQFVHEQNILHLDIKPSNIIIDKNHKPVLIDFGISKRYGLADQQETSTTMLAVSKGYASIEQYDNEGMQIFSPRPDIYSLGATIYYLLTGQVPTESILRSTKGLEDPRSLNPSISENTERVILKAMALKPTDRYKSVSEMMADLGFDPEKNKVIPPPVHEDNDKTELLLGNASVQDVQDEDVTLLHLPDDKPKKKSYKKWMVIISLFVFIGICLTLYANRNSLFFNNNADPSMSKVELDYSEHFNLGMEQFSKQNFSRAKEEFNLALSYKETQEARAYLAKIDSLTMLILEPEKVIPEDTDLPTEKNTPEIEKTDTSADEYMDLFNQAIHSYQAKNYENAKSILEKLSLTKNTTEVQKYIELTNKELDRIEIEKLKDLYELKMKFGNFVVARKKSTGLYGAIDDNGTEIISCKYRSSEKSGENRSFLRKDDDFYDIYAPNGTLIQERTSTY